MSQWNATNAPAGTYAFFVKFTAGGNTRFLYAPEFMQILPPAPPPTVDIRPQLPNHVVVGVNGESGQTIVLEQSTNLTVWQPVATNTLTASRWETTQPAVGPATFFRAARQ